VSILKNLSNLFIIIGDRVCFNRTYSWHVWACLVLMIGSVMTGECALMTEQAWT